MSKFDPLYFKISIQLAEFMVIYAAICKLFLNYRAKRTKTLKSIYCHVCCVSYHQISLIKCIFILHLPLTFNFQIFMYEVRLLSCLMYKCEMFVELKYLLACAVHVSMCAHYQKS